MENSHPIVDPQSRTQSRTKEVPPIRTPLTLTRIGRVDRAHFLESLSIPDVDLASEVTKPSDAEESSLRVVGEEVAGLGAEIVDDFHFLIEDDSFGGHD